MARLEDSGMLAGAREDVDVYRDEERYCMGCKYPLEGLRGAVCPECGRGFDPKNWRTYWEPADLAWRWEGLGAIGAFWIATGLRDISLPQTIEMGKIIVVLGVLILGVWWGWRGAVKGRKMSRAMGWFGMVICILGMLATGVTLYRLAA
ncbi:hypothetical protein [Poriferisphaera sp. WC338]|uniref:hypothetical protein n=1 Tax=Poriferisphaera sp. WC338 TaxID=3425129 RepID=UPI003D81BB25